MRGVQRRKVLKHLLPSHCQPLLLQTPFLLLPLLLLLPRQQSPSSEELERGRVHNFTCPAAAGGLLTSAAQGAVTPLRPGFSERARPLSRVMCVQSPWSVVRCVHLTLPNSGAGRLYPQGGVLLHLHLLPRSSTAVECSCQSHADGLLLMPQHGTPSSPSTPLGTTLFPRHRQHKKWAHLRETAVWWLWWLWWPWWSWWLWSL